MSTGHLLLPARTPDRLLAIVSAPLQAALASPALLFLLTLTVFLFRPPNLEFYWIDRIAFCLLLAVVLLRAVVLRQSLRPPDGLIWPMMGLSALAIVSALSQPFEASTWSTLAAQYIIPFALFWISGLVFNNERSLRWLEIFQVIALAYLSVIAIAFLVGARSLVFPPFILDNSLGIHADRARGPFLQAVANGVTLNLLALLVLDQYRTRRLRGFWIGLLLFCLPLAVMATKTRGVWLSFAISTLWFMLRNGSPRLRRACMAGATAGAIALLAILEITNSACAFSDRLNDRNPVQFRIAAYQAAWRMFLERPLTGWGANQMQSELATHIDDFRGASFAVHNTYLAILVEQGMLGFALYLWLIAGLFRLRNVSSNPEHRAIASLRNLWPVLLAVYFLNAAFVVMSYQFVNGFLFTLAGILAANSNSGKERTHVTSAI